ARPRGHREPARGRGQGLRDAGRPGDPRDREARGRGRRRRGPPLPHDRPRSGARARVRGADQGHRDTREPRGRRGEVVVPSLPPPLDELLDAWNAWDVERAVSLMHPDVEIRGLRAALENTTYRGREEARRFFAELRESWVSSAA